MNVARPRPPDVAVVIPTYNRARYLRAAVESVLAQTYADLELIVVDDGSTDETRDYLSSVQDRRLRVVRLPHGGKPARARNAGITLASGRYVAFLDSDDLWVPEKLAAQIRALRAHGCRWTYTRFAMVDDAGRPVPFRSGESAALSGHILPELISTVAAVAISSLVVDRDLIGEVGGFDESEAVAFREDYEFCLRLALRAPVTAVPEVLCYVRDHLDRATAAREDLFARSAEVYRRFERLVHDRRTRRLCRRRRAYHLVADAHRYERLGAGREALRRLAEAFPCWPWYSRWWVALGRSVLGAVTRAGRG